MDIFGGVPVLIEEAPDIEFRKGLFYITDRIGSCTIVRVMRPNIFLAAFRLAAEQSQEWRIEQSGVVERIDHWREQPSLHG